MSDLKPCPFCGGEAELDEYCGKYVVFCKNASCSWRETKAEAIEAWNTRHERTCREVNKYPDGGRCYECGTKIKRAIKNHRAVANYCCYCGARVKEE